jgi:dethiobiotin synthetase
MKGLFITGTDTEIGKTCITAGLAHVVAQAGLRVAAIKPVAAGQECVDGVWVNEDVRQLRDAGNLDLTDSEVGPWQLRAACAPHVAAQLEARVLDPKQLTVDVQRVAARADLTLIEGVGGFCVPLVPGWDTADMARDFALPVVLVVGMRLGCLSHAFLTAEAVRARGLVLAGWVGNAVAPDMPYLDEQWSALQEGLAAPCWGRVPRLQQPSPAAVAAYLNADAVLQACSLVAAAAEGVAR